MRQVISIIAIALLMSSAPGFADVDVGIVINPYAGDRAGPAMRR